MSNIGWVETDKKIDPQGVTDLLNRLNETKFRNQFVIIPGKGWEDEGYGWQVNHKDNDNLYGYRFYTMTKCYAVNDHAIETEHKGGGDHWMWWVDGEILNEIAVVFGGFVKDDAGEDCTQAGIPGGESWEDHLKKRWKLRIDEGRKYPSMVAEFTPPVFVEGIAFDREEDEMHIIVKDGKMYEVSYDEWKKFYDEK
jgi:hypothetical protein